MNNKIIYGLLGLVLSTSVFANERCFWWVPTKLNLESLKYEENLSKIISCSVEKDFRDWKKTMTIGIDEQTKRINLYATYQKDGKKYFEVYDDKGNLKLLIADKLYYPELNEMTSRFSL